jgi:hypothetical protein
MEARYNMVMVKEELIAEIEHLPDYRLQEVLHYVRYLHYQEQQRKAQVTNGDREELWADFVGAVSVEPFADNIDDQLYTL